MLLPQGVVEKLNVSVSEHIGFYEVNGEIVVRKIYCNLTLSFSLNQNSFIHII
jgi:hypothetical protein